MVANIATAVQREQEFIKRCLSTERRYKFWLCGPSIPSMSKPCASLVGCHRSDGTNSSGCSAFTSSGEYLCWAFSTSVYQKPALQHLLVFDGFIIDFICAYLANFLESFLLAVSRGCTL